MAELLLKIQWLSLVGSSLPKFKFLDLHKDKMTHFSRISCNGVRTKLHRKDLSLLQISNHVCSSVGIPMESTKDLDNSGDSASGRIKTAELFISLLMRVA
jgi:hypothetical protein